MKLYFCSITMILSNDHKKLVTELKEVIYPWRKYLIGVDGVTGSGKSSLARYLALELEMPVIETDMLRYMKEAQPSYRLDELRNLIQARHDLGRPIIVEGIFLLDTLSKLGLRPDYFIYVENIEADSGYTLRESLHQYLKKYSPEKCATYVFNTNFKNET